MNNAKRWPRAMMKLKPSDFHHGSWYRDGDGPDCGSHCCAVGFVAVQFGLTPDPHGVVPIEFDSEGWAIDSVETERGWDMDMRGGAETVAPVGSPMHKFARAFAVNMGARMEIFDEDYPQKGLHALSDAFEGFDGQRYATERKAASAWAKTLEEFGYVEDCEINTKP